MTAAPTGAATAWNAIMTLVTHAFTRPGFAVFVDLACGWVLTPGRRTVTRIIGVIDHEGRRAHDAYHRWLRDGVWQMDQLWRSLTVVIVARCVAPDAAVVVDLDDYAERVIMRRGVRRLCVWAGRGGAGAERVRIIVDAPVPDDPERTDHEPCITLDRPGFVGDSGYWFPTNTWVVLAA